MSDEILHELQAQTRWLRLLGIQALRSAVAELLTTEKQWRVYALSDGKRSTRQIAKEANVGAGTVSRLWGTWSAQGIAYESPEKRGRMAHLLHPKDLGLTDTEGVSE